jgi:hypothetical protein
VEEPVQQRREDHAGRDEENKPAVERVQPREDLPARSLRRIHRPHPAQEHRRVQVQAEIVRRIFREYMDGHGYSRIAAGLNADAVPDPFDVRLIRIGGQLDYAAFLSVNVSSNSAGLT